jgi:acyl-CoA synthetase (AMP-forming)/AMP-acid ligase II
VYGERRVSYAQLARRATQLAAWLRAHGVCKDDRVAVLLYNCPEYFELYFGCALLGALLVPINFRLAPPEVAGVLADSEPSVLVHGPEFDSLVQEIRPERGSVRHRLVLGGVNDTYEGALASAAIEDFAPASVAGADDLMILYSSGTTGLPKGSVWSHDNALWFAASQIAEFGFDKDDVTLIVCPLYNCGGTRSQRYGGRGVHPGAPHGGYTVYLLRGYSSPPRAGDGPLPPATTPAPPSRAAAGHRVEGRSPTRSAPTTSVPPATRRPPRRPG